jgi:DNA-binding response OmpR family regulator
MQALLIEDDRALSLLLQRALEQDGYTVEAVHDGMTATQRLKESSYSLVLTDLNLPGCDGLDVLRRAGRCLPSPAIIVLSARMETTEKIQCLDLGADDCLRKPFALSELQARLRAVMRRRQRVADAVLRCSDLEINRVERSVQRAGKHIDLTTREYELVEFLLQNKGRCVSRAMLLHQVWKISDQSETNVVDVYVNYVRRKLNMGSTSSLIHTVRGEGYVMRDEQSSFTSMPMKQPLGQPVTQRAAIPA